VWTLVDPVGDATVSMTGSQVAIALPGGVAHPMWSAGNLAPRLMQAAEDTDFEVEAKFDSPLSGRYQSQGILVEQDSGNFLRFDFYQDRGGDTTRIFAASFVNGSPTQQIKFEIASGAPQYLRIGRVGDQWTQWYSYDGLNWLSAGSFSHSLSVTSVGLFAGNFDTSSPAYTVLIDDFKVVGPVAPPGGGVPVAGVTGWEGFGDTLTHDGMATSRRLSASNSSRIRRA